MLFPGDIGVILPGQSFGPARECRDIGVISWITLYVGRQDMNTRMQFGKWSSLTEAEIDAIGKILLLNNTCVITKQKEVCEISQIQRRTVRSRKLSSIRMHRLSLL